MFQNLGPSPEETNPILYRSRKAAIKNCIRYKIFDSDFSLESQNFPKKNYPSRFFLKIRRLNFNLSPTNLKRNFLQKMKNVEKITIKTDLPLRIRICKKPSKFNLTKSILISITKLPNLSTLVLKCMPKYFEDIYEKPISKISRDVTFPVKYFSGIKALKILSSQFFYYSDYAYLFQNLTRLKAYSYKTKLTENFKFSLNLFEELIKFPSFQNLEKYFFALSQSDSSVLSHIMPEINEILPKLKNLGWLTLNSNLDFDFYKLYDQITHLKIRINDFKIQLLISYLQNFRQLTHLKVWTTNLDQIWDMLSLQKLTSLKIFYSNSLKDYSSSLKCLYQLDEISYDPKSLNLEKIHFITSEKFYYSEFGTKDFFNYFTAIPTMKVMKLNEFYYFSLNYSGSKPIFILGDRLLDQYSTMVMIFGKNDMKNFGKLKYLEGIDHQYLKIETLRLSYENFAGTNADYKKYYSTICKLKNLKNLEIFIKKSEPGLRQNCFLSLFQQVRSLENLSSLKLEIFDSSLNEENVAETFSNLKKLRNLKNLDMHIEKKCLDKLCMMAMLDLVGTLSGLNQLGLNVAYVESKIIWNKLIDTLQNLSTLEEVRLKLDSNDDTNRSLNLDALKKLKQENSKLKIKYSLKLKEQNRM